MDDLGNYYRRQFDQQEKKKERARLKNWNLNREKVASLRPIFDQAIVLMLAMAKINRPVCDKIVWKSHKKVGFLFKEYVDEDCFGWNIGEGYDDKQYIYLLTDGRLVIFEKEYSSPPYTCGNCIACELDITNYDFERAKRICEQLLVKSSEFGVTTHDLQRWKKMLDAI